MSRNSYARLASAETTQENTQSIIFGSKNHHTGEVYRDENENPDYSTSNAMTKITPIVSVRHLHIVGEKDEFCGESSNDNGDEDYGKGVSGYRDPSYNNTNNNTKLLQSAEFADMFAGGDQKPQSIQSKHRPLRSKKSPTQNY